MTRFSRSNIRAAKLTGEQVLDIRHKYHIERWSQPRLARAFGVSTNQIGRIVRNEAWQEVAQTDSPPRGRWEAPNSPALAEASHASEMRFRKLLAESEESTKAAPVSPPPVSDRENPFEEQEAQAELLMEQLIGKRSA